MEKKPVVRLGDWLYGDGVFTLDTTVSYNDKIILYQRGIVRTEIIIDDEGDNDHIDWLGIKESERRNGYGQAVLDSIIKDATDRGKKSCTTGFVPTTTLPSTTVSP